MTIARHSPSALLYRWRWPASLVVFLAIVTLMTLGFGRLGRFSKQVDSLRDEVPEVSEPKIFDARYDIWFDPEDPGLLTYQQIEDKFAAEDFVLVAFEESEHPLGAFAPESLQTIAALTDRIERIPYVRHVRSLTSNPWIRWGAIEVPDGEPSEQGLLITDLFEKDAGSYEEREIVERMVAVLGAERAAAVVREGKVREVLGAETKFADRIGEPRLIGNIISEDGRTTALQVQVLRPRLDEDELQAAFGDDEAARVVGGQMHGNHSQWEALAAIETALAEDGGGREFHIAGMPTIERNFMVTGEQDMGMVAWMFLAIIVVMALLFRRVIGVAAPLIVVFASMLGMVSTVFLWGDLLNNITAGAPNMITAVSIADAIHLVASYYALRPRHTDKRALIVEVLRINALPVFLTTVTTAIGFYSLTAGNIIPLQMLGYTAGLGALFAYVTSMTFVPALLSLVPMPKSSPLPAADDASVHISHGQNWATRFVDRVIARRVIISAASAIVVVLAVIGVLRIELDSDFRTMFPDDNVTMVDMAWIESRLGGAGDLEIVFEAPARAEAPAVQHQRQQRIAELRARDLGDKEGLAAEFGVAELSAEEASELARLLLDEADFARRRIAVQAEFLGELNRFTDRLREEMQRPDSPLRLITRLDGALDVLRKMNQVQNQDRAAFYRPPIQADVPKDAREPRVYVDDILETVEWIPGQDASTLAAQYFLQYENGAKPAENLSTLVSADRRTVRYQGRVRQGPSKDQQAAFDRIREIAEAEFPALTGSAESVEKGEALSTMVLSGKALLYAGMTEKFSYSFVLSMSLALMAIVLVIMLIFRSVVLGLVSIIPNVLPIFVPIGMFGLFGVPVDGPAVFVSSVALGIAVDDTIHLLTKFTRARRKGHTTVQALREALYTIGNALTFTTLTLVLGFAVLMFSDFAPNSMMGKLAAVMIGLAWVADFIVTPAVLALLPDPNADPNANVGSDAAKADVGTPALT